MLHLDNLKKQAKQIVGIAKGTIRLPSASELACPASTTSTTPRFFLRLSLSVTLKN